MSTAAQPQTQSTAPSYDLVHVCSIYEHRYEDGPPCTPDCISACGYEYGDQKVLLRNHASPDDCVVCAEPARADDPRWR